MSRFNVERDIGILELTGETTPKARKQIRRIEIWLEVVKLSCMRVRLTYLVDMMFVSQDLCVESVPIQCGKRYRRSSNIPVG